MENMKLMFVFKGFKKGSITMQITSSPRDTENKIGIIFCEKVYAFGSEANLYARGKVYRQGSSRSKERKTVLLTNFSMPLVCTSKKRCHLRSSLTTDYKSSECIAAA